MNFERRCYDVKWYFELGWIGDSEGRTWAKDLKHQEVHANEADAQKAMEDHPETVKNRWGSWDTKYSYGTVRVRRAEELVSDSTDKS